MKNNVASDTGLKYVKGRGMVNYIRSQVQRINLETRMCRRVRFRSCGTVVSVD